MVVWCGTEAGAVCGSSVFMGWCLCCYRGGCWFGERAEGAGGVAVGGDGWCGNRGEGAGSGAAGGLVLHERVGQLNRGGVVWLCWRGEWCLDGVRMADGQVVV